jgi:hypothetical protein
MSRALRRSRFIIAASVAVAAAILASIVPSAMPRPSRIAAPATGVHRPLLLLLTSLPLVFGDDFSVRLNGSPALKALERRYQVDLISLTDPDELAKGRLMLMAHPDAQPPEDLVALDAWVRQGGRVLLLSDPLLEWPSNRPLGDKLRPPIMFADTGLLAHWGLDLEAPARPGPAERQLGGFKVLTESPGQLSGACEISSDRLVAHCRIGKGEVTVIADADFLNTAQMGSAAEHNLDGLIVELERLQHMRFAKPQTYPQGSKPGLAHP